MRKTLGSIAFAAAIGIVASPVFAAEKVNIGVPSWTGAQAIAHLLKVVVETRIGGEAGLVPGNNATIFQAMHQSKGDIDVHPDVWLPNQESFTKKYVDGEGTVILSKNPYEGNQGFCVSKNFGEANKIPDIADLSRPDVATKMDSDGDGKGEMWIGAPGWASANVNEVKVRDYGLLDFIDPIRAEESKVAPLHQKMNTTPTSPIGTDSRIKNGSATLSNSAASMIRMNTTARPSASWRFASSSSVRNSRVPSSAV